MATSAEVFSPDQKRELASKLGLDSGTFTPESWNLTPDVQEKLYDVLNDYTSNDVYKAFTFEEYELAMYLLHG
jgi:hypothetical protein